MPAAAPPDSARPVPAQLMVWAGVLACVLGLVVHRLWEALPATRFAESLVLALLAAAIARPLARRTGSWATALAGVWSLALVAMSGLLPSLATLVLAAGALALGTLLAPRERPVLALLLGLALLGGISGWLLPLPVHRAWTYAPLLVALVAWRRRALRETLAGAVAQWRAAVAASPVAAGWTVLAVGLASSAAWLPTLQYDDLAYHLALPWQLLLHGRYALDPTQQVWALAPWLGDVVQAIPQVISGAEARGPVNALWLAALAAGSWRFAAVLGAAPAFRWAAVATVAMLPLLAALLGGMQTELPAAAVAVALAVLVFDDREWSVPTVTAVAVLSGALLGLKLIHPAALAGVAVLAAGRAWRPVRAAPRALVAAPVLLLVVGGSSYLYATVIAGNPVLPLFNAVFQSPAFAPENFRDARWPRDAGLALPWDLTFNTARYLEGWSGGAGFVLVALAGAFALAFTRPALRAPAACAAIAIAVPLLAMPYARYTFVGLVLLVPVALRAVESALPRRAAFALVVGLCLLDLAFAANSGWVLRTGGVRRAVLALGADAPLLARYGPERLVYARLRVSDPDGRVADLSGATHAELAGRGRSFSWYAPRLHADARAADADASGGAWAHLLCREGVRHAVLRPEGLPAARRAGLVRLGAYRVLTVGDVEWWAVPARKPR